MADNFKLMTEPRDRRGEHPVATDFSITDEGEALAFYLHSIWCEEANYYKTPDAYARHKLRRLVYGSSKKQVQLRVKSRSGESSIKDFSVSTRAKNPLTDDEGEDVYYSAETKQRPESLWELIGTKPLFMLSDERWSSVVDLAEHDGEVWYYVREWYIGGIPFDPPPKATAVIEVPLVS